VLRLASRTDPAWVERALARLDDVLLDHAHCEKKAAGAAVRLLFSYPEARFLQEPLARLAREELAHFEEVLGHLRRRGVPFARQRPAPYAGRLLKPMLNPGVGSECVPQSRKSPLWVAKGLYKGRCFRLDDECRVLMQHDQVVFEMLVRGLKEVLKELRVGEDAANALNDLSLQLPITVPMVGLAGA